MYGQTCENAQASEIAKCLVSILSPAPLPWVAATSCCHLKGDCNEQKPERITFAE